VGRIRGLGRDHADLSLRGGSGDVAVVCQAREQGQPLGPTYRRIARRVILLWIFGIVVQHLRYHVRWSELDLFSKPELYSNTLQAIAVGYLVTSLALLHLSIRGQIVLFFVLLLGYWPPGVRSVRGTSGGDLGTDRQFRALC